MLVSTAGRIALLLACLSYTAKLHASFIAVTGPVPPIISCSVLDEARQPTGLPCSDFVTIFFGSLEAQNGIINGYQSIVAYSSAGGAVSIYAPPDDTSPYFIDYLIFATSSVSQLYAIYGVDVPVYLNIHTEYTFEGQWAFPNEAWSGLCSGDGQSERILISPGETFSVCASAWAGMERVFHPGQAFGDASGGTGAYTRFWITATDGQIAESAIFQAVPEPETTVLVGLPLLFVSLRQVIKRVIKR
jgi:hypothetical protein